MLTGLYLSAAGMQAQELRLAVTTNNLANAQVNGFKRDLALMQARLQASEEDTHMAKYLVPSLRNQGGGVNAVGVGVDLKQAPLKDTSNQTDVALDGPGFFTVKGAKDGEKNLTRDGSFLINSDGTLVTATGGHPVLSSDGQPIVLNPELPVTIASDGTISQGETSGGVKLGLADVKDQKDLVKLGGNLMTVQRPEGLQEMPASTQVRQYHVEQSGVDPVIEMVNMLEGQRVFEANAKMVSFQDTTLSELNTIGKVA
jgi:flagellar basal body rod protein FlgG